MKKKRKEVSVLSLVSLWFVFIVVSSVFSLPVLNFNVLSSEAKIIILFAALGMLIIILGSIRFLNVKDDDQEKDKIESNERIESKKTSESKSIILPEVSLINFEKRPRYKPFEKVNNGLYAELTENDEITYHVVDVLTEQLPDGLEETNQFIQIEREEKSLFDFSDNLIKDITSFPPGSYHESGYYIEIDVNQNIVSHIKYAKKRLPPTTTKGHRWIKLNPQKMKVSSKLETTMIFPSIQIEHFSTRPRFESETQVQNGYFLEITKEDTSTDRIVDVKDEILPKVLTSTNQFIEVSLQEKIYIQEKHIDPSLFEKYTPGSYTSEGYYIEVDVDNQLIDNIKYTERRLPPTTSKGHRWIHFNPRTINE